MNGDFDLLYSVFLAKKILDENKNLISAIELDRQFLGKEKFNFHKKVPLHTCVIKVIPIIKKELRKTTGVENTELEILKVDASKILDGVKSKVAGIMQKKKNRSGYVILISQGESYCTQRLTLCKELFEVFVDCIINDPVGKFNPHNRILEVVRELTNKFYSAHEPKLTDKFTSTETFAHSIALELMIPYTLRPEISEMLKKRVKVINIAERLRVTQETLEHYLQNYYELTTPVYDYLK